MPSSNMSSNTPTVFAPDRDLIALHYDCSPDPDDLTSAAADRTLLEATFGTSWLSGHVLPAIGTYGRNTAYKEASCERVAQSVWGDSTGYLRAAHRYPARAAAVALATEAWARTLEMGGQIYIKEGGQSDFTVDVVRRLEHRHPGSGRCVHVVQHAGWNEDQNSDGVTAYLLRKTDYLRPLSRGGIITDGNRVMQSRGGRWNAPFVSGARSSWMGCAWDVAIAENERYEHYGACWNGGRRAQPVTECLDVSDTHELAFILGLAPLGLAEFFGRYLNGTTAQTQALQPVDCSQARPAGLQPLRDVPPPAPPAPPPLPPHGPPSPPASPPAPPTPPPLPPPSRDLVAKWDRLSSELRQQTRLATTAALLALMAAALIVCWAAWRDQQSHLLARLRLITKGEETSEEAGSDVHAADQGVQRI